jgi:hypothetical protein
MPTGGQLIEHMQDFIAMTQYGVRHGFSIGYSRRA